MGKNKLSYTRRFIVMATAIELLIGAFLLYWFKDYYTGLPVSDLLIGGICIGFYLYFLNWIPHEYFHALAGLKYKPQVSRRLCLFKEEMPKRVFITVLFTPALGLSILYGSLILIFPDFQLFLITILVCALSGCKADLYFIFKATFLKREAMFLINGDGRVSIRK